MLKKNGKEKVRLATCWQMVSIQAFSQLVLKRNGPQVPLGPHGPCSFKTVLPSSINSLQILKQLQNEEASILKVKSDMTSVIQVRRHKTPSLIFWFHVPPFLYFANEQSRYLFIKHWQNKGSGETQLYILNNIQVPEWGMPSTPRNQVWLRWATSTLTWKISKRLC